jgi:hypothetical protein
MCNKPSKKLVVSLSRIKSVHTFQNSPALP